jgi:hypothetical protein
MPTDDAIGCLPSLRDIESLKVGGGRETTVRPRNEAQRHVYHSLPTGECLLAMPAT